MSSAAALDREYQLPRPVRSREGRLGSLTEAMALIPEDALLYVTGLMGTPTSLLAGLAANHYRWRQVTTVADYLFEPLATFAPPDVETFDRWPFRHVSVQPSGATSTLPASRLAVVPAHSSGFYRLFQPGGRLAVNVALVQISPPGPDGRFSLGVAGGVTPEVVCTADIVIAEINWQMPYVGGVVAFDRDAFDILVETDHELTMLAGADKDSLARAVDAESVPSRIAAHLADEVENFSTIEYGIGAIPDAAVVALSGHVGLGLHSGLIGEAAMALIDGGTMDGSAKTVDRGLHVASAVVGGPGALEWMQGRDDVAIVASNYSHGVANLGKQERFVAINSAIEVALDGSVNAEQIGERVLSGPGGQPDFAAAAAVSNGGRAFVALPSTARRRSTSRIVAKLDPVVPTTVPRYLADRVVTEHGTARLRGASLDERRNELLGIADEIFQIELDK